MTFDELPALITRPQLSEYLQISIPTLARWAANGEGPDWIKLGGSLRYRKSDVLAWIEAQPVGGGDV